MPTPKSKRIVVLQSSFEGSVDQSEYRADGRLLRGDGSDQRLLATSDADWWIEGRGGADVIFGAGGDDLLIADRARLADAGVDGDPDTDDAVGVLESDVAGSTRPGATMNGGAGNDLVAGSQGGDRLVGGLGDDSLWGFEGDDVLLGGAGNDFLAPGLGAATIEGGAGLDTVSWADLAYATNRGALAGVVLNLSDRLIRYDSGDQQGEARILVQDAAGGFGLLGEADTAPTRAATRPEGVVELDIAAGTGTVGIGLLLPAVQKVREAAARSSTERFEGTLGLTDVVVLPDGFAFLGATPEGDQRWSDGTQVLEFRGFEVILIA